MATRRNRVGGSGYTIFNWNNQLIASARQITHTSPAPVGPGVVPIHPLDTIRPTEIITPAAISMGQLQIELYELYGKKIWDGLLLAAGVSLSSSRHIDLADVYKAVADTDSPIVVSQVITPPKGAAFSQGTGSYTATYNNCVISSIEDGETIETGTMEILKRMNVAYTHVTSSLRA